MPWWHAASRAPTRVTRDRRATGGATIRLRVTDDGSQSGATPCSFGLLGMAERALTLGGSLRPGLDPRRLGRQRPCCPWTRCHDHSRCRC